MAKDDLRDYWETFYASRTSANVPIAPSAFAEAVGSSVAKSRAIVEFGFGNARDSLWFASRGHSVMGYDFANSAVKKAQALADEGRLPARFAQLDLYDFEGCKALHGQLSKLDNPCFYGRFLIHSLKDQGRHNLFDLATATLRRGGELMLEFRTGLDKGALHLFGDDHFRTYLDPASVTAELEERGGRIVKCEQGYGLAMYKDEDPHIARITAVFS